MIFVDSNIPMYLVGAEHPHKVDARRLLERLVSEGERLVTDVEVFQEILHRFVALKRREAIQPTFDVVRDIVDEVFSIHDADTERAKTIVLERRRLSARDAIHLAVMEREGVTRILTFDTGFDAMPGIQRISS
ncbi:MAG TPA: type II toxin-antitoxin system VapC family toxin [Candidatus Sulfotelmatobacter sp.]|jgi:predicted nucleic acid-binding protein|nr:type II toxin-antitoxin system VapC family toxin [Candidatus Sulfotelmatobacter sp.]